MKNIEFISQNRFKKIKNSPDLVSLDFYDFLPKWFENNLMKSGKIDNDVHKEKFKKQFSSNEGGIYIFVVDKDYELNEEFFSETVLYKGRKIDDGICFTKAYDVASIPSATICDEIKKNGSVILKKDQILYVGMRKEKLLNRVKEHLTNNKINGCKSLKLGFETRCGIKNNLRCYVAFIDDKDSISRIEKLIRQTYGSYFGNGLKRDAAEAYDDTDYSD